jgi:hypothetical protein
LSQSAAALVASYLERTCSRKYASATAFAMAAAFAGSCEFALISMRKVVRWRATFSRY